MAVLSLVGAGLTYAGTPEADKAASGLEFGETAGMPAAASQVPAVMAGGARPDQALTLSNSPGAAKKAITLPPPWDSDRIVTDHGPGSSSGTGYLTTLGMGIGAVVMLGIIVVYPSIAAGLALVGAYIGLVHASEQKKGWSTKALKYMATGAAIAVGMPIFAGTTIGNLMGRGLEKLKLFRTK